MIYILMNPLANNKKGEEAAQKAREVFATQQVKFLDVRAIRDAANTVSNMESSDVIVLAGGDGTLNRFVNDIYDLNINQQIYLYPCGSGNDFAHDVKDSIDIKDNLIPLNKYIQNLPVVMVNGMRRYFLNGIGFGIDGYCCEMGDEQRNSNNGKPINYTMIAIKGCLGKYKPTNATITVDGVQTRLKKVWMVPTMNGCYYGGGMKIAPTQVRGNPDNVVTVVGWHGTSRLSILMKFSSVFTGQHIKYKKHVFMKTGHNITVTFDKPQSLQIDGETVKNVYSYTVRFGTGDD